MPTYSYLARDTYGRPVRGTMVADSEVRLSEQLANLGYTLTRLKIAKEKATTRKARGKAWLKSGELLNFTIHLSTLINAGVPLIPGLKNLANNAENTRIETVINDICQRVESGSSLKEAVSRNPLTFSNLYSAILGAGEATGELSIILNDLAAYLEWHFDLRSRVKEASTYPVILLSVMIIVVLILLICVIPTFEELFSEIGVALPLPTQIILNLSLFTRRFWYCLLLGIGILVAGYKFYYRTSQGHYNIDSLKLRILLFGTIYRKVALSRFCHTVGLALKSGMNLLSALDLGAEVVGNKRLNQVILNSKDSVNMGEKLATSLSVSKEFPSLVITMIGVGEESGKLSQSFEKINEFYEKEVPATIKKFFTLLEPMLIISMGVVVGGLALSVLLPLVRLIEVVGG